MITSAAFLVVAVALSLSRAGAQEFDPRGLVEAIRASRKSSPAAASGRPYAVLSRFVCAGAGTTEADLRMDLQEAREAFAACGVGVRAFDPVEIRGPDGGPCPPDFKFEVDHDAPVLSESQRGLFARYHRRAQGLSVFYLPWSSAGPDMGGSSIPEDYVRLVKRDNETDRASIGALAVFHKARARMEQRFVLPHEMGHILINDSSHSAAAGNLMESFSKGRALTKEQCSRILASPFLRRD